MRTVELRPAHTWDCDECGRENFCRGIVAELTPEEKAEIADAGGSIETGHWLTAPEAVECAHCGAAFRTERYE